MCLPGAIQSLDLQRSVAALDRDVERMLSNLDRSTMLAGHVPQSSRDVSEDSSQPRAIAEPGRQGFCLSHDLQDVVIAPERNQRDAQIESRVDGSGERFVRL